MLIHWQLLAFHRPGTPPPHDYCRFARVSARQKSAPLYSPFASNVERINTCSRSILQPIHLSKQNLCIVKKKDKVKRTRTDLSPFKRMTNNRNLDGFIRIYLAKIVEIMSQMSNYSTQILEPSGIRVFETV